MRLENILKRKIIHVVTFVGFLVISSIVNADQFDKYRVYIDDYDNYQFFERDNVMAELENKDTNEIEKYYLLGMLYFIQGVEKTTTIASSTQVKAKVTEVLNDTEVRTYFLKAENNYNVVEKRFPGYKYIYCKFAELYQYSFNGEGLRKITNIIGHAVPNDQIIACRGALENAAETLAASGHANLSKMVYEEAVKTWPNYPEYMLDGLGDIEFVLGNKNKAVTWWKRCVGESKDRNRKERCEGKINKHSK